MQCLNPLKVPWQVSPSTPFLRLLACESQGDHPTQVIFIANFGLRAEQTQRQDVGFEDATRAENPVLLADEFGTKSKSHSVVRMVFQEGTRVRMSPAFSDREVLDPKEFDPSHIPYSTLLGDMSSWVRDFQSLWMKSGSCPDPGAYSVEASQWGDRQGFEHFLVQGHDSYIEVLARGWEWEEIQKLPEWW